MILFCMDLDDLHILLWISRCTYHLDLDIIFMYLEDLHILIWILKS